MMPDGHSEREEPLTHNALHQDMPSTFLKPELFLQACYSQLNSIQLLLMPSIPRVSSLDQLQMRSL